MAILRRRAGRHDNTFLGIGGGSWLPDACRCPKVCKRRRIGPAMTWHQIFLWWYPLANFRAVEGNDWVRMAAWRYNREHRQWALDAAGRWSLIAIALFGLGSLVERLSGESVVATGLMAIIFVAAVIQGTMAAWAMVLWLLLSRGDE